MCWTPLCVNKQNKNTTQYVLDTTMCKQTKQKHYTICVGHHYKQNKNTTQYDKEKQNKNTTQYVLDTTMCKQTKQKHYTICVGHHYVQTNTNNVNKTSSF